MMDEWTMLPFGGLMVTESNVLKAVAETVFIMALDRSFKRWCLLYKKLFLFISMYLTVLLYESQYFSQISIYHTFIVRVVLVQV